MNENRISQFETVLNDLVIQAGDKENTKIYPNAEVINASPSDLPAGYIVVKSETGYYVPAVLVPGLTVSNGDFVNIMYIKGTEPIAFQHGSQSSSVTTGGVWPKFDEIKVLFSDGTVTSYTTMALAVAALTGGEVVLIGPGTYPCASQQIQLALAVIGSGKGVTILQTSTSAEVLWINTAASKVFISDLILKNTRTSGDNSALTITTSDVECIGIEALCTGATSGSNYGVATLGTLNVVTLRDCYLQAFAATTTNRALNSTVGNDVIYIYGGRYDGAPGADVFINGGTVKLYNPVLVNNSITGNQQGSWLGDDGVRYPAESIAVINSSGVTANVGDIGYLDEAGEYRTTTAEAVIEWVIVAIGGANGTTIRVQNRGIAIVNYTGSAPAQGDFLTTSATAGLAQARSTMHYAIFAVCLAAGSGGSVEVLLLAQRKTIILAGSADLWTVIASSSSDFVSTVAATGVIGDKIYYSTITSGSLNTITPNLSTHLAKCIIHNTTLVEKARIIATGTDGTGNFIQVSNSADIAAWVSTNAITARSQTKTDIISSFYHYDIEITSSEIPPLATGLIYSMQLADAGTGEIVRNSAFVAGSTTQLFDANNGTGVVPLIARTFCSHRIASGSGTLTTIIRLLGYTIAAP